MTTLGIDISKWDGVWDAAKAKSAGAEFVFIKASQATFTDPLFAANWAKAQTAGLLRGAFHYLDYTKPARDQANYLANLLRANPGELPPVVDFEQRRTDNNILVARTFLRDFIDQIGSSGYTPILYTSNSFWNEYGESADNSWTKHPLWIAHYTTAPSPTVPPPWPAWTFWQYTSKGSGPAFGTESMNLDLDYFNGSKSDLLTFAHLAPSTPETPPTPPPVPLTLEQRIAFLEKRVTLLEGGTPPTGDTTPPSPPPTSFTLYAVCTAAGLNVRSGPGATYPIIGGMVYGQKVKVQERKDGWSRSDSPSGWFNEKYVNFVSV
jgi:lysozyme